MNFFGFLVSNEDAKTFTIFNEGHRYDFNIPYQVQLKSERADDIVPDVIAHLEGKIKSLSIKNGQNVSQG